MAESEPKPKIEPEIDLEEEVLGEAFELKPSDPRALEKEILSVAFLLEVCSGEGNEPIDGAAASGLAAILRHAAEGAARLRRQFPTVGPFDPTTRERP